MNRVIFVTLTLATLTLVTILSSTNAYAGPTKKGYYLGVLGGYSELSINKDNNDAPSYGAYLGYQLNKDLAFESTYIATTNLVDDGDLTANTLTFAAKLHHIFSPTYSMFIKLGVATTDIDRDDGVTSATIDGTGWLWGAGFNAELTDTLNLRLAYEEIQTDMEQGDSNEWLDTKLANLYLGFHYHF